MSTDKTPATRYALLIRGRYYFYKDQEFEAGKFIPVTPEVEAYLDDNAYDVITLEGEREVQHRKKFKFFSQDEKDEEDRQDELARRQPLIEANPNRPTPRTRVRG